MNEELWSDVAEIFLGKAAWLLIRLAWRFRRRARIAEAVADDQL